MKPLNYHGSLCMKNWAISVIANGWPIARMVRLAEAAEKTVIQPTLTTSSINVLRQFARTDMGVIAGRTSFSVPTGCFLRLLGWAERGNPAFSDRDIIKQNSQPSSQRQLPDEFRGGRWQSGLLARNQLVSLALGT